MKIGDLIYHKDYEHLIYRVTAWDGGDADHAFIMLVQGVTSDYLELDGWITPDKMNDWRILNIELLENGGRVNTQDCISTEDLTKLLED